MTNPDLIPVPFAQDGQKNPIKLDRVISDPAYMATWLEGFPPDTRIPEEVGGEAPDGLDFNGLFNALSQAVVFLQKGNAYQFDGSLAPYPVGALVRSDDNLTTYQSTAPSNSNDPNSNMTGWKIYNGNGFVVDNLTTNDSTKAVSAAMGKKLQDEKFAIANLVNDLTTGGIDKALTAEIGKVFFNMFSGGVNYFRIPNPLDINKPFILQFSQAQSNTTGDISFNFPISFPNSCLSVNASPVVLSSANNFYFTAQTNPPTKTNVTGKIFQNGSPANSSSIVVLAIGN